MKRSSDVITISFSFRLEVIFLLFLWSYTSFLRTVIISALHKSGLPIPSSKIVKNVGIKFSYKVNYHSFLETISICCKFREQNRLCQYSIPFYVYRLYTTDLKYAVSSATGQTTEEASHHRNSRYHCIDGEPRCFHIFGFC